MKAAELVQKLKESGTGQPKIDCLDEFLKENPDAKPEAVVLHAATLGTPFGFGPVTLGKLITLAGLDEKYQLAKGEPDLPPSLRRVEGIKTVRHGDPRG